MAKAVEAPAEAKATNDKKDEKKEDEPEELSEEDQRLKDSLEGLVNQLSDSNATTVNNTIVAIGKEIKEATTSMTSVPKPLKFLRPMYPKVKAAYDTVPSSSQKELADVISVLATVSAEDDTTEALEFRLKGTGEDPGAWGHEYMRHLASEISTEYNRRTAADPPASTADLMHLVKVRSSLTISRYQRAPKCRKSMQVVTRFAAGF
jgi:26S proteasome regulatory subunit N1